MSINVVVSSTAAGVSVSGGTAVAIAVSSVGASVPVTVGGGIGPAGFLLAPGTVTSGFGTFQLTAGEGITISTSAGQFQIASYGATALAGAAAAPVQSVAGRTGVISLATADVAGLAAVASSGSYTSLQNVPATFAPSAHTHGTAEITGISSSFAAASHAHPYVTQLNSLTGALTLAAGTGVTLTTSSSTITIASTGGGSLDENAVVDGGFFTGSAAPTITITQQPANQTASSGAATFTVVASVSSSGSVAYQWEKQESGSGAFSAISGATSSTLALTGLTNASDDQDVFRVVVSAFGASSVTSSAATLTVAASGATPTIAITQQPTNQTAASGSATFAAAAAVSPSGTPAYQWQKSGAFAWVNQTIPNGGWTGIAYGNSTFAMVEYGGNKAATSADGIMWTETTLPGVGYWYNVGYGNGVFVTASYNSNVAATSSNGLAWTERSLPSSLGWFGIAYGNDTFVLSSVGSPHVATSAAGIGWTLRTLPASSPGCKGIAYGNSTFVLTGNNSNIALTSADGVAWTQRSMPSSRNWDAVAFGNGVFVALAYNSNIAATSADGIAWTPRTLPVSGAWNNVAYANGTFVATSSGQSRVSVTSADGITWTQRSLPVVGDWWGVAHGNGTFVATAFSSNRVATSSGSVAFANISGATSASLALTGLSAANNNGDQYRVVASATGATSVTSNAATLTVT